MNLIQISVCLNIDIGGTFVWRFVFFFKFDKVTFLILLAPSKSANWEVV